MLFCYYCYFVIIVIVVFLVIIVVIVNNQLADQEAAWSHHLPPPFPQFCRLRRNLPPFHKFTAKVDSKVFLNFWNCICQLCARLATTQLQNPQFSPICYRSHHFCSSSTLSTQLFRTLNLKQNRFSEKFL